MHSVLSHVGQCDMYLRSKIDESTGKRVLPERTGPRAAIYIYIHIYIYIYQRVDDDNVSYSSKSSDSEALLWPTSIRATDCARHLRPIVEVFVFSEA